MNIVLQVENIPNLFWEQQPRKLAIIIAAHMIKERVQSDSVSMKNLLAECRTHITLAIIADILQKKSHTATKLTIIRQAIETLPIEIGYKKREGIRDPVVKKRCRKI